MQITVDLPDSLFERARRQAEAEGGGRMLVDIDDRQALWSQ